MSITRDFKLSLVAGRSVPLVINANQYDDGEIWRFTLLDENGQKYSPSTGSIIGLKSDGHIIANAGTVSSTGLVIIPETEQMTASPGKNFYELLIDDDTHGTANFIVFVEPRPGAGGTPSDSDLAVFQEAIEAAGNIEQFQADISALQSGLATTNANLTSEANTRASADATLQSNISAEASTRQTQDAVLQAEIDQIIAPTGEAPSAAEVQNARIGVDGTTYDTLGNAIRGQVANLKNALDENVSDLKSDISELDSAVFKAIRQNLITKSNIRNGASSGANSIVVDKDNLTLTWDLTLSINTDSSAITLSTVPLTLDTSKEYFFYARINALSNNTINNGAIGVQWQKDGQTPQYIGVVEQLYFSPTMSGIICSTFVPSRDNGYLRFVFNGMTTATKRINLFVDKLVFCEMPASINVSEMEDAIASLDNPVLDIRFEKNPCPIVDILFWGDSLTAGAGGKGTNYPSVCATELGKTYRNCGVGGETANTISARQGGNNIVIPVGNVNGTYTTLSDIFGASIAPLLQGNGSDSGNALIIDGQTCKLSHNSNGYTISGYTGDAITVPKNARFRGSNFTGKVVVIFVGQNGATFTGLTSVDARIAIIDSMIKHIGHERYVIMGLSTGTNTSRKADDNQMLAHYGNKFMPTRKLLVDYGLTINGLTPTAQDTTDISNGTVPTQLRSDGVHMNAYGYTAIGKLLADKIRSLGYV